MRAGVERRSVIPGLLAWLSLVLSLLSAALFVWAPLAYHDGQLSLDTALMRIVPAGLLAGLAAIFVVLVRGVVAWRLGARGGAWPARIALVLALVAVAYPLSEIQKGARLPRIHDITTDPVDPPNFVDIAPLRQDAPNGEVYGGEKVAQLQATAYPDIAPIILPLAPEAAFEKARAAVAKLGWHIVAAVPDAGRLEATDTTIWFRFPLDIVIRIRPDGEGSRVDVRSVSRIGDADRGANAARIRAFRAKLG
jgi:uncharacterized protein (DUF1499 family)